VDFSLFYLVNSKPCAIEKSQISSLCMPASSKNVDIPSGKMAGDAGFY
jgi:hypothetical protein